LQKFAAAGRRGVIGATSRRSGLTRLIAKRYIAERAVGVNAVQYVITDRGRRALAEANGTEVKKRDATLPNVEKYPDKGHRHDDQR